MRGRACLCAAVLPVLLAGCAMSQLALGPGENGEAGSVAVLNSAGTEIAVVDKPGAVASVSGSSASVKTIDSATFDAKYADLLAALPPQPRTFVLYFKENSVEPTEESQAMLAEIFAEIKKRPGADLEITGHTDTVGSEEVNDAFSLRRAAEITSYLFSQGLDKTIVRIAGRGERELLEKTPDETASAKNRRVEVIVR